MQSGRNMKGRERIEDMNGIECNQHDLQVIRCLAGNGGMIYSY